MSATTYGTPLPVPLFASCLLLIFTSSHHSLLNIVNIPLILYYYIRRCESNNIYRDGPEDGYDDLDLPVIH